MMPSAPHSPDFRVDASWWSTIPRGTLVQSAPRVAQPGTSSTSTPPARRRAMMSRIRATSALLAIGEGPVPLPGERRHVVGVAARAGRSARRPDVGHLPGDLVHLLRVAAVLDEVEREPLVNVAPFLVNHGREVTREVVGSDRDRHHVSCSSPGGGGGYGISWSARIRSNCRAYDVSSRIRARSRSRPSSNSSTRALNSCAIRHCLSTSSHRSANCSRNESTCSSHVCHTLSYTCTSTFVRSNTAVRSAAARIAHYVNH